MGKSSENIFTAYKKAAEAVTRLELWQDKLTAWQMVADFCRDGGNCPLESKPARDTVLFWTYNNMGNLAAENDPDVSRAVWRPCSAVSPPGFMTAIPSLPWHGKNR